MTDFQQKLSAKIRDSQAREAIASLLDKDSFTEFHTFVKSRIVKSEKLMTEGVVTGTGTINQRQVFVYAQNFKEMGGTLGEMQAKKIVHVYDLALKTGSPIIAILNSAGARIQEGVFSLDGYGQIFKKNIEASGKIPQISVVIGPSAGGAAYSSALTDFIFMIKDQSLMFITGPKIIKTVTGEEIGAEELGGALVHNQKSGVAQFMIKDERSCFSQVKQLLTYLPSNNLDDAPFYTSDDPASRKCQKLESIVPTDSAKVYDMKQVIESVFDRQSFFEIQTNFAKNAVVGFARLVGKPVGVVANQPKVKAGCLDISASTKIAKFVQLCDCFNIPIINLVDVPGYLPGIDQEHGGIIRHGAKLLYAYSRAQVPKISLILRKAYGGAYIAMASKGLGYDIVLAWPEAEIGVMGAEQALNLFQAEEVTELGKKDLQQKIEQYKLNNIDIYKVAATDKVDQLVARSDTRKTLVAILQALKNKTYVPTGKRHGNIPL
jgi:acetyl-CoA carboxylase carboxyltransferase component